MLPGIKLFDLSGQAAIVTGGSKGLGLAMAEGLASAGADVMLVSRHQDEAQAAAQRIATDYGRRAIGCGADVSNPDDVEALVRQAADELGRIDILINNAGINIRGPIDKLSLEEFRKVQQINVEGLWLCCRAVTRHMKQRQSGRIINLASTLGVVGLADRTPYASSKGAVVQMTRAGPGARTFQHHRQRDLPRPVPDGNEHPDQERPGGAGNDCRRGRLSPLGRTARDPRRRDLSGQPRRQLHDRQPAHRRRRLDGTVEGKAEEKAEG